MNRKIILLVLGIVMIFGGAFAVLASGNLTQFIVDVYPASAVDTEVRIQVPDLYDLKNVTIGKAGKDIRIDVNNTGTTNIRVTPKLVNGTDPIMRNLYARKFLSSSNASLETYVPFGNFSFTITKPSGSETFNPGYFYVMLNLTDYTGSLTSPLNDYSAQVYFEVTPY